MKVRRFQNRQVEPSFESPIEARYWRAWQEAGGPNLINLRYQHEVGRYRVDFAVPELRLAVELDGYEYHSDREAFTADRVRQRELELAGWRFIRFSGSEVYRDARACIEQTVEFARTLGGSRYNWTK